MPVKNEDWILERSLQTLSFLCDVIIIADQDSTDNTLQIARKFPKVTHIHNPHPEFHQSKARQLLLEAARDFDGYNVVLATDADEIVSANALRNFAWQNALDSLEPGSALLLQWIILWKSPVKFREDSSAWSNSWKHFVFRDDRKSEFSDQFIHESRVPYPYIEKAKKFDGVKILHYQFVDWSRMLAKQRWYRVMEHIASDQRPAAINARYIITRDERNIRLADIPSEWTQGWEDLGIHLDHFEMRRFLWYDIEILRSFAQHGVRYFAELDIWDVDWERKRQLALAQNIESIPSEPIRDPRNLEQRLFHAYLDRYISTPWWRRDLKQPALAMAKRVGLKRSHLERLGLLKTR